MDRKREDGPQTGAPHARPQRPLTPMPSLATLTRAITPSLTNLCQAQAEAQSATANNHCLKEIFSSPCQQQQQQEPSHPSTCIDVDAHLPSGSGRSTPAPSRAPSMATDSASECDVHDDVNNIEVSPGQSVCSIGSVVCRICHNNENPETLVAPCLCKGSLTYVHIECLERWITTSRSTMCELCQFRYDTQQTLRYTLWQSLRLWYSRSMSRRALQEDCQMFSLLTLVAFGIIGTLLVGIQYYILQEESWGLARLWTRGWLVFFLLTTLSVYLINVYMILRSQLVPWYRWWQSAREIKLILENRKPLHLHPRRANATQTSSNPSPTNTLQANANASDCEAMARRHETAPPRPIPAVIIPLPGARDANVTIPLDDLVFEL